MTRIHRILSPRALLVVFLGALSLTASAATATLRPSKDTTIYGNGDADLSNGGGAFLFAGRSDVGGGSRVLRSLVAFDLAGQIPANATINSVTLTLAINTPDTRNSNIVELHRVTADWGEGTSVSPGNGGGGAPATTGSATWNARFFNTLSWTTPGGDFSSTVSASQSVELARGSTSGTATFSGAGMVSDVQAWVNNAANNFGWILVAKDETPHTAVRFASREGSPQPTLVVDYTAGSGGTNTAPAITTQPASQTVAAGASVTFTVAANGTPAPTFQWRKDGQPIPGETGSTLALSAVTAASAGAYTVIATNAAGSATSNTATLAVTAPDPGGGSGGEVTARLSNLSVRAAMNAGQALTVGFVVSGGDRPLVVRGVGPTLGGFGVAGVMTDPRIELRNSTGLVAQNDNWGSDAALSAAFTRVGAFGLVDGSLDAALLRTVNGAYTVQASGTGAGVVLVELYDAGSGNSPRLINVSARNQVGTGQNILIFGFVIEGTGSKRVLIRGVGPTLSSLFGLGGVLVDPRLDVFSGTNPTAIASNDNWDPSLASTFTAVGAFQLTAGSRDAALVTSLAPGPYTVQVSGVNSGTGEALVEIYEVP